MPRVLNKKVDGVPVNAIYVGRPTKWGNPFFHILMVHWLCIVQTVLKNQSTSTKYGLIIF